MAQLDRRSFLTRAGVMGAATVAAGSGVEILTQRLAAAAPVTDRGRAAKRGYGELRATGAHQRR